MPAYYDNNDQSSEEGYRPSVRIRFPTPMLLRIDQIANSGRFMDRSEAIHEPPDMNRQQSRAQAVQQRASLAAAAKKASSYPASSTVIPDDPTLSGSFRQLAFAWRAPRASVTAPALSGLAVRPEQYRNPRPCQLPWPRVHRQACRVPQDSRLGS